jgi:hypothetical protein
VVAAFALSAWIAIGSLFVSRATDDTVVAVPASLLVGSGLTAAAYAILTRFGFVDIAIWSVAALSLLALALRRSATARMIRELGAEYHTTLRESRVLRLLAVPIAAILWICAIAPPRDADVMRYHLAHIRQIISDGRWERIPDYHYAFPFGWTLDYLPFERIHLVQAASLVNLGLWLVMVGGLLKISRAARTVPPAAFICAAFLVHPFVLRVFSSATPDGYGVFVVYTIAILLLTFDIEDLSHAAMLGFVSWIGAQSRYQLLAVAIAGTLVFLGLAIRRRSSRAALGFSTGVVAAIALCAPFYIANLNDFGNPFWPLLVPEINGTNAYTDRLAALYSASLVGQYDLTAFGLHFFELITTPSLVPLALVLVFLIPASMTSHTPRYRHVAVFGSLILLLWAMAQPRLFPKHVVLLLPLGPLLAVAALDGRTAGRVAARAIHAAFGAAIVTMLTLSSIVSWDYIRYAITGNSADYHRFTWYYPVYEWANRSTPRNARFLVVAYSGHSYYLDRQYRRADPWLSGVVDWSRVSSAADLDKVVREGGYDFMIYDDRDWSDFEGGSAMSSAVKSAIAQGTMVPVHRFNEKLYSSRFFRDFTETTVYVLRRGGR